MLRSFLRFFTCLTISIFCLYASPESLHHDRSSIAVVNIQFVLDHSIAAQSIRKEMEKMSNELYEQMALKEKELKKLEQDIVARKSKMSDKDFENAVVKFNNQVSSVQRSMQDRKLRLEQAHSRAMNIVHKSITSIINQIAKEKGFDIAIPDSVLLFSNPKTHITQEVTTRLNQRLKSVNIKL